MKKAFVAKGGSGKTTLAAAFAQYVASLGHQVLALDADINQHLAAALGVTATLRGMGEDIMRLKRHLAGTNQWFTAETMTKTTPPGHGSGFVTLRGDDWFMRRYTAQTAMGKLWVAGAGEVPEENIGTSCYHGLSGAIELLLGHLIDADDEYVIVDMTAGADALSSSLFAKVDAIVLVVEPTRKSLSVFDQCASHLHGFDIPLLVVANKITDPDDLSFITQKVGEVAASFPVSSYVKRLERGEEPDFAEIDNGMMAGLEQLYAATQGISRDWQAFERRIHDMHRRNAEGWMGQEVLTHIDPEFSLQTYAQSVLGRQNALQAG